VGHAHKEAHLTILVVPDTADKVLQVFVQNPLQRTLDFIQRNRHVWTRRQLLNNRIHRDIFEQIPPKYVPTASENTQTINMATLTCGTVVYKMRLRKKRRDVN